MCIVHAVAAKTKKNKGGFVIAVKALYRAFATSGKKPSISTKTMYEVCAVLENECTCGFLPPERSAIAAVP